MHMYASMLFSCHHFQLIWPHKWMWTHGKEAMDKMLAGMLNLLFWSSIWNTYIYSGAHLTTATFFARLWVLPSIVSLNIYSSSGHELYISLSIYAKGIFILQLEDLMCSSAILLSLGNHENSKRSIHITSTTMFIHKYFDEAIVMLFWSILV